MFRVVNSGNVEHSFTLLPLDEDIPSIEEQVRGDERRAVTPFARLPASRPGQERTVAVDLVPGHRYALICTLLDPDGEQHALKGMTSEFRAGTAPESG